MSITKSTEIPKIEVVNTWIIQVATDTVIKEDGKEISRSRHRHCLEPFTSGKDGDTWVQNNLIDIRDCLDVKIINLKPTKPQTYCKHCGTPLKINYGRGRPRQFCSDSHKNMWSLKQREERRNEL